MSLKILLLHYTNCLVPLKGAFAVSEEKKTFIISKVWTTSQSCLHTGHVVFFLHSTAWIPWTSSRQSAINMQMKSSCSSFLQTYWYTIKVISKGNERIKTRQVGYTCHSNACKSVSPLITTVFPGGIDYSNMDEWEPKTEKCTGLNINVVIDHYKYIF